MEEKSEARQEPSSYEDATKNFEYSRLRILIPKLAAKESVSKIEVVEEAINYIAQLQNTLSSYHDVSSEDLQQQFLERERKRSMLIRERNRRIPSYLQSRSKRKPRTLRDPVNGKRS